MHTSAAVPCDAVTSELDEPRIRPASGPPPGTAGDPAEVTLRLVQDHDRIAGGMNDIVVHRLFSAGLCLETALGLLGDHPGAAKVQDAIGELDLAIRDSRNVMFDRHQPDSPPRQTALTFSAVLTRLTFLRTTLPELSAVPLRSRS